MPPGIMRIFVLVFVSVSLWSSSTEGRKLLNFCYFTNWSNKLASFEARFDIRDINATLCSHLIYAFANIDANKMKLIPSQNDDDNGQLYNKKGRYFDFAALKVRAPHLVTLLSVGGASAGKGGFLQVVHSRETMMLFSRNCAIYLRDRDFDGIDIDWEYPEDIYRNKFTQLLQIMRDEFDKEAIKVSKPKLVITIAVGVGKSVIDESYNITAISNVVDYISVMTYDFHGPWSSVTSFSGPLFPRASNTMFDQRLAQSWAIDYWIKMGAPPSKIVMGMTGAAVTFTLPNMTNTGVGAPVLSVGKAGPYLQRDGHVTYYRVCEMIRHGAVYKWDNEQKMSYAVLEDQWVGYGNEKSMREKVKYAYDRGIAGTMFWSMDLDDFHGTYCNKGEFPLLTAIYNATIEFAPKDPHPGEITGSTTTPMSTTPVDYQRPMLSFCYFTNWSNKYSSFEARFQIRDINTTVCSHLIYAFANIDTTRMELVQTQNDDDNGQSYNRKGRYYDFTALKMRAPHLVTLLSVGGAGSSKFQEVVRSTNAMRLFSRNCAVYLRDKDFDGLDIDWEYPNSIHRANFTQLLKIMGDEFTKESGVSKPALLITVTVSPFEAEMNNAYDIPAISSFVDYIHVQSYDFYGLMSSKTGFSSPLFPRQSDSSKERQLAVSWAIDSWIKMGAPANKIVMGLTGSAVTFTLANMNLAGAGAPVKSPGKAGPYLLQNGHVTYYEVCEMKRNGAVSLWDNEQKVPYAVLGNQWVGYDNEKSMREKVKFAIDRGIAGTSFWSIEMDDFNGSHCYDGKYPLLTAIYDATLEFSSNQSKPEKITGCPTSQKSTTPDNSQKALLNFCYFNNWSNKRAFFDARFDIRDINATLCSHLIYAFAGIDTNTMKVIPTESDDMNGLTNNSSGQYNELAALKRHSPHLVSLLSVGGRTIIGRLEQVVRSNETMQLFSRNSATFLREEDFDGIDINLGLLDSTYKAKFTQFLQIMRYEFITESKRVNKPALLITVSVNYTTSNANKAYDIPALSCIVDYIHVQTYDFHGPWSQNTSFTSPLYPRQSDSWLDQQLTVSWAIDYWTKMGASASKIVMGMTGTALTYTLKNLTNTRVGAPVQTIGKAGPFLMESGHATYYRVCELVSHGAKTYFDSVQNMSYAVFEDQWIGYETAESLTEKVKFASDKRLAGVSFWSLDVDDFHGTYCNQGKFPLLTAIYNAIHHKQPAINTGNIIVG